MAGEGRERDGRPESDDDDGSAIGTKSVLFMPGNGAVACLKLGRSGGTDGAHRTVAADGEDLE